MTKKKYHGRPPLRERLAAMQPLDPHLIYTPETLGRTLGMSGRWVMDHLITPGVLRCRKEGDYIGIPGWEFAQWVESDLRTYREWKLKSAGDLTDFCKSIEEIGLLHPIVLTNDNKLVAAPYRGV